MSSMCSSKVLNLCNLQTRTNNTTISTAFDQTPISPSIRSSKYRNSHHNKSLIFVPASSINPKRSVEFRHPDHGIEYLYGNEHRESYRTPKPKLEDSFSGVRESDNYGSFAKGSSTSVKKRTIDMFTE